MKFKALVLLLGSAAPRSFAAEAYTPFPVDLPGIEAPYDFTAASLPSMQQAVRFSKSAYQGVHFGLGHLLDPYAGGWEGFASVLGFAVSDFFLAYMPPFDSWVHEEFHRTVMGQYGIGSYDAVYDLPFGASTISVTDEEDQELADLKRDHPADMVRLAAAGIEGEALLVQALERDAFFSDVGNFHQMLYLMSYLNSWSYVSSGSSRDTDTMTDEMNAEETSVKERDFVGHDFTSWVYDLHRPDEPYAARGSHPTGVGINRYRKYSDLSDGERRYMALQGQLYLLNFVDPQLFGVTAFPIADGERVNGSLHHMLGPFGAATGAQVFYRNPDQSVAANVTIYRNQALVLPGLTVELLKAPLPDVSSLLPKRASFKAQLWQQPSQLRYDDTTAKTGGLADTILYWPIWPGAKVYWELEGKTAGWVPGSPYLDDNVTTRLGLEAWIF